MSKLQDTNIPSIVEFAAWTFLLFFLFIADCVYVSLGGLSGRYTAAAVFGWFALAPVGYLWFLSFQVRTARLYAYGCACATPTGLVRVVYPPALLRPVPAPRMSLF